MDDLVRTILERDAWADKGEAAPPPDLRIDLTARVVALLVEQVGGRVAFDSSDIAAVPSRLILLPFATGDHGIQLQVRRLAPDKKDLG
jgi:hypothetical protein